jgi:hypothetical protein
MTAIKIKANYYGGLNVQEQKGKYYWIIENYDTDLSSLKKWEEISKTLYNELIKHNDSN